MDTLGGVKDCPVQRPKSTAAEHLSSGAQEGRPGGAGLLGWGRARRPWEWLQVTGSGSAYPGVSPHVGMQVRLGRLEKGDLT